MKKTKKISTVALSSMLMLSSVTCVSPVHAASNYRGPLTSVQNVSVDGLLGSNVVTVTYNDDVQAKITFLEDGIFRFNVDPKGEFSEYASPKSKSHLAKIQAQPDDSDKYSKPHAKVVDGETEFVVTTTSKNGTTSIHLEKATGKMTVKSGDKVVLEEKEPLTIQNTGTVQTLTNDSNEYFYGGGTQNGRFSHKGEEINIANESGWTDGGVASPNPFYWSTKGYGVLRNTFANGKYNFGKTTADAVTATHNEAEFDAYYFVSDGNNAATTSQDLLQGYYKVTGNPVLLPEYGFYEGHLNCYNRDAWADEDGKADPAKNNKKWTTTNPDGTPFVQNEAGGTGYAISEGLKGESLNGKEPTLATGQFPTGVTSPREFSAQAVIDRYVENDMPLGYFLPNDGYGCGYGQNGFNVTGGVNEDGSSSEERIAAVDANVENLQEFTEYANSKGVATGLWTQSNLSPTSDNSTKWHLLRDFEKEVTIGGITTLKTDVAWVGAGYSFQLNGVKTAYDIVTTKVGFRPNIISLDGWAGSQRFNSVWTGDQYGGNWEYIRFHIPTYIGQSLAGNPNIGSDMDGIFGGAPIIATRDYQWKTFTPQMLNMDGWGTYFKGPHAFADPYKSTDRMYLKLKAQLMPYIYTSAASASNIDTGNDDTGLPMIRAMFLEYPDQDYAYSKANQYQYMFGDAFLVAPLYQNTAADAEGNDIRNDIYLPAGETWIDYFTGQQYRGGAIINNFDAPLWKLPLFVKNGSIVPMYEENNTPDEINKANRIVEFWPEGKTTYTAFEDDGKSVTNETEEDAEYGVIDNISYGDHVSTKYESVVDGDTATLTAHKSTGSYKGYDQNKNTTFVVNVSQEPASVKASNGSDDLTVKTVDSKAAFEEAAPKDGEAIYFYDANPTVNTYSNEHETRIAEMVKDVKVSPKLYVKFAETDSQAKAQTLVINGFVNDGNLPGDDVIELAVPTIDTENSSVTSDSVTLQWNAVDGATSYDVEADGIVYSMIKDPTYTHKGLSFLTEHEYRVRAVNHDGHSQWSEVKTITTADDPYRNVPKGMTVKYDYGSTPAAYAGKLEYMIDGNDNSEYSSRDANVWTGKSFTIDMKKVYSIDQLDYAFRENGGNGAIHTLGVAYSIDGETWTDYGEINLDPLSQWPHGRDEGRVETENPNARYAHIDFDHVLKARYLRIKTVKTTGGFLQAYEIRPYHLDGDNGIIPGDLDFNNTINGNDKVWLESHHPEAAGSRKGEAAYESDPVKAGLRDLNANDIFDAYDIALMTTRMNNGVNSNLNASGNLKVIPSKTTVKAGEKFSVGIYGINLKNVYALDFELPFAKGDIVNAKQTDVVISTTAKTKDQQIFGYLHTFDDAQANDRVYATLSFNGDHALLNGDIKVATVTLTAARDLDLSDLTATAGTLVGSSLNYVNAFEVKEPEVDTETEHILTLDDMTITSEEADPLQSNMGADKLVDGKVDADAYRYEFRWGDSQETVVAQLPHEILYNFNTAQKLSELRIQIRHNGSSLNQGALKDFDLIGINGTEETLIGSYTMTTYDQTFELNGDSYEAVKLVCKTSQGGMAYKLNIDETSFITSSEVKVKEIKFADDNPSELFVGRIVPFAANVLPSDASNQLYAMESDNDGVRVLTSSDETGYHYSLLALEPGATANITVKSLANETLTATTTVSVSNDTYTNDLKAAIDKAESISGNLYTEESFNRLLNQINVAKAALTGTQDEVDMAEMNLLSTIALLEYKGSDNTRPDSPESIHIDESGMTVIYATSEATGDGDVKEHAIDNDPNTIWHSSYQSGAKLPVEIIVDLGDLYNLEQVNYLARQNSPNGHITHYRIEVSSDNETYTPVVEGYLSHNGWELDDKEVAKLIKFAPVEARYVKLIAYEGLSTGGIQDKYASVAELDFYGEPTNVEAVDKAELQGLYDEYKLLDSRDYTTDSWKEFADAMDMAKAVLDDAEATQDDVNNAKAELAAAKEALVEIVIATDKTALQIAVDMAKEADLTNVVPAVVEEFTVALAEAEEVLANEKASVEAVEAAFTRLAEAMHKLNFFKGDKDTLIKFFDNVKGLDSSKYIESTWGAFEAALNNAQAVIANENAMQEEVNETYDSLVRAFLDLRLVPNKDALKDLIGQAEALNEPALATAIANAKAVYNDKDATQVEVDNATKALSNAINGLKDAVKPAIPVQPGDKAPSVSTGDNTNIVTMASLLGLSAVAYLAMKKRKEND